MARYSKHTMRIYSIRPITNLLNQADKVKIDCKKYQKEIKLLHKKRKSRNLIDKTISPKSLRNAIAQDQSYRSRILSIMLECKQIHSWLNRLKHSVILRVINDESFSKLMPVKTKTDKKDYLEYVLNKKIHIINDLANTIEMAHYVIEDIDKSAWGLKLITNTFELSTRPEFKI